VGNQEGDFEGRGGTVGADGGGGSGSRQGGGPGGGGGGTSAGEFGGEYVARHPRDGGGGNWGRAACVGRSGSEVQLGPFSPKNKESPATNRSDVGARLLKCGFREAPSQPFFPWHHQKNKKLVPMSWPQNILLGGTPFLKILDRGLGFLGANFFRKKKN